MYSYLIEAQQECIPKKCYRTERRHTCMDEHGNIEQGETEAPVVEEILEHNRRNSSLGHGTEPEKRLTRLYNLF